MRILSKIKGLTRKAVIASAMTAVAVTGFAFYSSAHAANLSLNGPKDCDSNSVLWCGASSVSQLQSRYAHGDGHNSASSIQHIYDYFGISSSDISSMSKYAVAGEVYKDGTVKVGNEVVADGVTTAGRLNIPGSKKVTKDGTTFYTRPPRVSFVSSPLQAYVVMKNGKFQFAILASCGNPVTGHAKSPSYSIVKRVRTEGKGSNPWEKSISVKQDTPVQYHIVVSGTGQVSAKNITVRDNLPNHVNYISGTLHRSDGKSVNASDFFGSKGNLISSLAPGKSITYTFEAIIGKSDDKYTCRTLNNVGMISAPGLPTQHSTATAKETCVKKPQPAYACTSLSADKISDDTYKFTAKASASNGAKIVSYTYDFGDKSSKTVSANTIKHTYGEPKTYTAKVTVNVDVNGKQVPVTGKNCQTTVKVVPLPGSLACTELLNPGTVESNGDQSYTFTAKATATHAKITQYVFNLGAGHGTQTIKTNATSATTNKQTYTPGTYKVSVTVSGVANGSLATAPQPATCATKFTVKKPAPKPSALTCDSLTLNEVGTDPNTGNATYTLAAAASVTNATITKYVFTFGNGTPDQTVQTSAKSATSDQTVYDAGQSYSSIYVTVYGKDAKSQSLTAGGANSNCSTNLTVPPLACTAPNGKIYPAGSSECTPTCTAPNGQTFPAGSPNCEVCKFNHQVSANSSMCVPPTTPTPPSSLPNTGAGDVFGLFTGASIAGGIGYRLFLSRRLARR